MVWNAKTAPPPFQVTRMNLSNSAIKGARSRGWLLHPPLWFETVNTVNLNDKDFAILYPFLAFEAPVNRGENCNIWDQYLKEGLIWFREL